MGSLLENLKGGRTSKPKGRAGSRGKSAAKGKVGVTRGATKTRGGR
tara:strand:- start:859 stop:996 length:138 start_codon:yes stop_codon:yes gene_type:complete